MKLNNYHLGELIEAYSEKCGVSNLSPFEVSGVNSDKEFFEPSKQVGADTSNYKVVPPGYFACNLMHVGRDRVLPIAFNHSNKNKIVSPAYTIFKIINKNILLDEYFFMMLKSNEQDRYFWFHTDSSVRDGMSWEDFCDLEINIPNLTIQRKYAEVYLELVENQKVYERGIKILIENICPILIKGSLEEAINE